MRFKLIFLTVSIIVAISGCKKKEDDTTTSTAVTAQQVLHDFAYVLANPNYLDMQAKALLLKQYSLTLSNNPTDQNLQAARNSWRELRLAWEQAEGFLFGPVQDYNYDPATDSWPVNTVELDSLLASNNPLELENIDSLQYTLKGYHPVEYVLFGVGGTRTAADLTVRELKYLTSLTQSLYNTLSYLVYSWDPSQQGNFTIELTTAGNGSQRYSTRKDAFIAIVNSMKHICDEVANNKMQVPLAAHDSELVESQYAHNATTDFTNNIKGVQNAYLCQYSSMGKSISDLVKEKNLMLDNDMRSKITAAINSLSAINANYGEAIFNQPGQIYTAQNAITELSNEISLLANFIQANINE